MQERKRDRRLVCLAYAVLSSGLLLSGCSGARHMSALPNGGGVTLQTPQSISPGLIAAPPMAQTAILPSSAMQSSSSPAIKPMSAIPGISYTQVPGTATVASAGSDGSLWVLSDSPSGADKYIWHYSNGSWTNIAGLANHISAAPDGSLYASNSLGGVYHYVNGSWIALGGGVSDITAASGNTVYALSNGQQIGNDQAIWFYNGTWAQIPGSGVHIAASLDAATHSIPGGTIGPDGLYVVNSSGSIYYTQGSGSYIQIPGASAAISPSTTGGLFVLGYPTDVSGTAIYYYDFDNPGWQQIAGSGVAISAAASQLYVISASNAIYSARLGAMAHFTISDPYPYSSASIKPQYFSPATASVSIVINDVAHTFAVSPNSPNCTVSGGNIACAIDIPVRNGPLTYSVQTLDRIGDVLSAASGDATINGFTTIPLALQGTWHSATARFSNAHPTLGTPTTITVNVSAYDASGALIVGPEPYTNPIPLYNSDTSGATQLSATSVTSPTQTVTLSYNGALVNVVVSAVVPPSQASGQQDTLVPSVATVEYPIPSGTYAAANDGTGAIFTNNDGTLSFLENVAIGHVTTNGVVTETKLPYYEYGIAKGPDGNVWLVCQNATRSLTELARLNADGTLSQFPLPDFDYTRLTLGADGNFWMTSYPKGVTGAARRVTPTGVVSDFLINGDDGVDYPTAGPDGNVWYTGTTGVSHNFIKVTPAGQVTVYPLPSSAQPCCDPSLGALTPGPDGRMYSILEQQRVGSVDSSGNFSELTPSFLTSLWNQSFSAMTFGPDNALWISLGSALPGTCNPVLGHMTTSGSFAMLVLPNCAPAGSIVPQPNALVIGPDGNLWYTRDRFVGKIILP